MAKSKRERVLSSHQRSYWDALSGRYAQITRITTDDFHYGPQIPGERDLRLLPELCLGASALELGCGMGQNSIFLASRGVRCTAMDISSGQLEKARALAASRSLRIDWRKASLERFECALGGCAPFDLVHSSHALEFVDNPAPVIAKMAKWTLLGGYVVVSTVHPLFNGLWIEGDFEDENGEDAGDAGPGLFLTNYFSPPDDIRDDSFGRVISRAWPVSDWFDWFREAGLEVVALKEPAAVAVAPYTSDDWADHGGQLDKIPSTLIIVGRKAK